MLIPNFLIIGSSRCGTTSLYRYLKQHPQIYMSPVKEPSFFSYEGMKPNHRGPSDEKFNRTAVTKIEDYGALFKDVTTETAIGEASTNYIYNPKASERINHYIPNARLLAILRHPVERAYSSFLYLIRDGREPLRDIAQAIEEEPQRIRQNWAPIWNYKHMGFYYDQLKRYFDQFDRSQIRVYLYDDFSTNPSRLLQDIFQFIGVVDTFVPDTSLRHNVSGIPRSRVLHKLLTQQSMIKYSVERLIPEGWRRRLSLQKRNLIRPTLPADLRRQLIEEYREDILKLQELIQRDLSKWLE
ncbi:MAG TPA: sulfotransferase [Thermodesulfobacteriota bacterium]|nr:sulfotransferase [Thermodesulfobacteriota bacterium]